MGESRSIFTCVGALAHVVTTPFSIATGWQNMKRARKQQLPQQQEQKRLQLQREQEQKIEQKRQQLQNEQQLALAKVAFKYDKI